MDAPAVIGNLTAVNRTGFRTVPNGRRLRALRRPHHRRGRARAGLDKQAVSRQAEIQREVDGVPTLLRMKVGVVGLGYVGLPLAVAFAEEGHEVAGLDADPRKIDALAAGTSYIEDVPSERLAALGRAAHRDEPLRGPELVRRGDHLRPDSADQLARARPELHDRRRHLAGGGDAEGPAGRARVDHLPGHDAGAAPADPGGVRPRRGPRLPPRLLARADRSGPHRLHDPDHPEGGRRADRRSAPRARWSSTARSATRWSRSRPRTRPS